MSGIPDHTPEGIAAVCRSRLLAAANALAQGIDARDFTLAVGAGAIVSAPASQPGQARVGEARYIPSAPLYKFDQLVIPHQVRRDLVAATDVLKVEQQVFDGWGLRSVEPFPRSALNFHGPSGTGKTLAAHAMADHLERGILMASYADIESKYHGDGPKNVQRLFSAADESGAVLFIDEADSLLSRRLTNVTQGSEQAINSMRSQLLICLERFRGVVIFATNLVQNYDNAFETRVRHVRFTLPDKDSRTEIWRRHLVDGLPVADDVDPVVLAEKTDDICGRDIKNAVVDAAVRAAVEGRVPLIANDFLEAVERIKNSRMQDFHPLAEEEKIEVEGEIRQAMEARR
ncbi:ATP-binding protein [Streptomyces collinus]|uniref:ATP-binding protein n=1 Tax=Streptomyces collinus TaxID=42684 RepID=UPI00379CD18E